MKSQRILREPASGNFLRNGKKQCNMGGGL